MRNRDLIVAEANKQGFEIGCYDSFINKLSLKAMREIVGSITGDSTDIAVDYRGTRYVIEMGVVDREIDFNAMKLTDYIRQYGEEYADKF